MGPRSFAALAALRPQRKDPPPLAGKAWQPTVISASADAGDLRHDVCVCLSPSPRLLVDTHQVSLSIVLLTINSAQATKCLCRPGSNPSLILLYV